MQFLTKNASKIVLLILIISAVAAFFALDLNQYASLDYVKEKQSILHEYYLQNRYFVIGVFSLIYITVTALSLPAATALTILSGALFGFLPGLIIASFSSSIGASIAFLIARFMMKNWVQDKYGKYMVKINEGIKKEGAFYLFALRLTPLIPFFIVNITMGLLPFKLVTFYLVSQIGMLAGTAVYVYAGTQVAQLESLSGIVSPPMLAAFVMLGLFPLLAKKAVEIVRKKAVV